MTTRTALTDTDTLSAAALRAPVAAYWWRWLDPVAEGAPLHITT